MWRCRMGHGAQPRSAAGKNSLAQLGLLTELSQRPLAVTITDPMPGTADHTTARRRRVLERLPGVAGVELLEVRSDFRSCWDNWYTRRELGYRLNVNELTDCILYMAATTACAAALGITHVFQAHENEQIDAVRRDGATVIHPMLGASEVVLRALTTLFKPLGVTHSSLISPLKDHQCEALLWRRYRSLAPLQVSCWQMQGDAAACNACMKCFAVGMMVLANGGHPAELEMDIGTLLDYAPEWEALDPPTHDSLPYERAMWRYDGRMIRALKHMNARRLLWTIARRDPRALASRETWRRLRSYAAARRKWSGREVPPDTWVRPLLGWVDPALRDGLAAVLEAQFGPGEPGHESLPLLDELLGGVTAPLAEQSASPAGAR